MSRKGGTIFAALVAGCSAHSAAPVDASPPARDARGSDAISRAHDAGVADVAAEAQADGPAEAADAAVCNQSIVDQTLPATAARTIEPSRPVTPFFQWENDDGYCGETGLIQAGLGLGQWTSQFNARLLCGAGGNGEDAPVGTPLLQSGPDGYCAAHAGVPDYNAQLLLEANAAANAATCAANMRLATTSYPAGENNVGMAGYQDYMAWVKAETIAGSVVSVAVLDRAGTDSQYDHIVTVLRVETNHDVTDATYYDDDVLVFDDHGAYSYENGILTGDRALPPGTGGDTGGCTPYVYAYRFGSLPATRAEANLASAQGYTILIPGVAASPTHTGGDGTGFGPTVTGHNYGVAVTGVLATDPTLPVSLRIVKTTANGAANPDAPVAGYDYEDPMVGAAGDGLDCTNAPPSAWMSMTFDATVSGLTRGQAYVLYEYDTASITGVGSAAALDVPLASFNGGAGKAAYATPFTATGPTYVATLTRPSSTTFVLRAVAADAP
jgi:hypothetical protein